jgi:hypothetical protein
VCYFISASAACKVACKKLGLEEQKVHHELIIDAMKKWFRNAEDRNGGRAKRGASSSSKSLQRKQTPDA